MSYVSAQLELLKQKNTHEPEFLQAAQEVLASLEPVINANPKYEQAGILERITEPERQLIFRVPWVDDRRHRHWGPGDRLLVRPVQAAEEQL